MYGESMCNACGLAMRNATHGPTANAHEVDDARGRDQVRVGSVARSHPIASWALPPSALQPGTA